MSWSNESKNNNTYKKGLKHKLAGLNWNELELTWDELKTLSNDPTWDELSSYSYTKVTKNTNNYTNESKN